MITLYADCKGMVAAGQPGLWEDTVHVACQRLPSFNTGVRVEVLQSQILFEDSDCGKTLVLPTSGILHAAAHVSVGANILANEAQPEALLMRMHSFSVDTRWKQSSWEPPHAVFNFSTPEKNNSVPVSSNHSKQYALPNSMGWKINEPLRSKVSCVPTLFNLNASRGLGGRMYGSVPLSSPCAPVHRLFQVPRNHTAVRLTMIVAADPGIEGLTIHVDGVQVKVPPSNWKYLNTSGCTDLMYKLYDGGYMHHDNAVYGRLNFTLPHTKSTLLLSIELLLWVRFLFCVSSLVTRAL
jgi:hypothetical protein